MRLDNNEWFKAVRKHVSLSGLCVQEPGVAARRINKLNERIAQLEAERAELVDLLERCASALEQADASLQQGIGEWFEGDESVPAMLGRVEEIVAKHKEQA